MLKIKGFTLIELLVTLTIASIILAGLIELYVASMNKTKDALNYTRLEQTLQNSMMLMASDIRRTGYWGNSKSNAGTGTNTNPFLTTTDIYINPSQNCILLGYDRNGDGTLPSVNASSDDERYGFRLLNNAIQSRPPGANYDCNATADDWEDITDPNVVNITQLSFTKNEKSVDIDGSGAGNSSMKIRTITISITGQLVSDTSISKTLSMDIKVRNDKYTP